MEFSELGKTPISEESPTGSDPGYEPEFEALEEEMDKMFSPSSTESADWNKVIRIASKILAEKAKDLRVASRFAVARIQLEQTDGFVDGVRLFADLIENYWDKLFPPKKRMRGRVGAIEWWLERAESLIINEEPPKMALEKVDEIKRELERLGQLFSDNLKDPPSLNSLRRFIDSIPVIEPEPSEPGLETIPEQETGAAAEEKEAKSAPSFEKAAAKPVAETPPPKTTVDMDAVSTEQDAVKAVRAALATVRQLGSFLRDKNLMDPLGYRCTRIAAWTMIENAPPAAEENKTALPPPAANLKNSINELQSKGNYETLVKTLEGRVSQYIFWLDLNRYSAETLASMGERYQKAYDAVCLETAKFAARFPGIENLAFQDGLPFADEDTKKWLKSMGAGAAMSDAVSAGSSALSSEREKRAAEIYGAARELVRQKKVLEALSLLRKESREGSSGREGLLWRLYLCRLLIEAKEARLVIPHLERIIEDIDKHNLENWEPDLALDGLRVVWLGFNAMSDEAFMGRIDEALDRIARLDPAEALKLARF